LNASPIDGKVGVVGVDDAEVATEVVAVAAVTGELEGCSTILNMTFHPSCVKRKRGRRKDRMKVQDPHSLYSNDLDGQRVQELNFEMVRACDCRPVLSDCTSLPRVRDGEEKRRGEDADEEECSRSSLVAEVG